MPKFMIKASYNADGVKGLVKDGGTARRDAINKLIVSLGGQTEAFYFAYGEDDAFVVADLPDTSTALAISLAVNASGAVRCNTMPLITAEDMDAACTRTVAYKVPGK